MWICSYGVVNCPECRRSGDTLTEIASDQDRIYFRVKYDDKEDAKQMGCRWDPQLKLWYAFLRNPQLVEIGKRWRVMQPQPATGGASAEAPAAVRQPVTRRQPKEQYSLESLLGTPIVTPTAEPEPKPGSIPYEEFMAALRAADEMDAKMRPSQVREHLPLQSGASAPKKGAPS